MKLKTVKIVAASALLACTAIAYASVGWDIRMTYYSNASHSKVVGEGAQYCGDASVNVIWGVRSGYGVMTLHERCS